MYKYDPDPFDKKTEIEKMPDEQLLISPCGRASIGSMPGEWPRQKK